MTLSISPLYNFFTADEVARLSTLSITHWQEAGVWSTRQMASYYGVGTVKDKGDPTLRYLPHDEEQDIKNIRKERPLSVNKELPMFERYMLKPESMQHHWKVGVMVV